MYTLIFAFINISNMGTNRIQKVTVVAHHQHYIFVVGKKIFQPTNRFDIKTTNGYRAKNVGIAKQCPPTAIRTFNVPGISFKGFDGIFPLTPKLLQTARIAFGLIATHFTKIAFQLPARMPSSFCKVFLWRKLFLFVHRPIVVFVPHQHGIKTILFIKLKLILLKHSHSALPGVISNGSLFGSYLTTEYFQESTFACARWQLITP